MRAGENVTFKNISATTADFTLTGGKYGVTVVGTFDTASCKLQRLAADTMNYLSVSSATDFAAAGYATVDLPPGTYIFTIASATGVYADIQRIPAE